MNKHTTTDPFNLMIEGVLAPTSEAGSRMFADSVEQFRQEIADDPGLALEVIGTMTDLIDTMLINFAGMDAVENRVAYLRICQDALRSSDALANDLEDL